MDFELVDPQIVEKLTDEERRWVAHLALQVHPLADGEKGLTLRSLKKLIKDLQKPE